MFLKYVYISVLCLIVSPLILLDLCKVFCVSCFIWPKIVKILEQQDMSCMYYVTLRGVRGIIVAVEKQCVLHILSVCLWPWLSSTQSACAVLYCHLWSVGLCDILPHNLINGATFGKMLLNMKSCVLIFCTTLCLTHFLF
jgi:hypothetical protein